MDQKSNIPMELSPLIKPGTVFMFSTPGDNNCIQASKYLKDNHIPYNEMAINLNPKDLADKNFLDILNKHSGFTGFPKIYIGNICIGGYPELEKLYRNNEFLPMLQKEGITYPKTA